MEWFTTNISRRLVDHSVDFNVFFKKSNVVRMPFKQASIEAAYQIANQSTKQLYVAFSGGYDSEYIVRLFHMLKIDFVPLIVVVEGHEFERSYAYKTLLELGITAEITNLSRKQFVSIYYEDIFKKLNGSLWASTHVHACKFVESKQGSIVFGTHVGGIGSRPLLEGNREQIIRDKIKNPLLDQSFVNDQVFFFKEYDYYCSALFPELQIFDFFTHTPELTVSMLDSVDPSDYLWEDYKERVYKLRYRPKTSDLILPEVRNLLEAIRNQRKSHPADTVYVGNKENFRQLITYE